MNSTTWRPLGGAPAGAWLAFVLAAASATDARAVLLGTSFTRDTEAVIEVDGVEIARRDLRITNGPSESTVTEGAFLDPLEARASGRADDLTITANAEYDIRDFNVPGDGFTSVRSSAETIIEGVSLTGGDVVVDFFLPPGFVEIRTQGEASPGQFLQSARIFANLLFCFPTCLDTSGDLIYLDVLLSGDWFAQVLFVDVRSTLPGPFPFGGPPTALDLSPLDHLDVTVTEPQTPLGLPLRNFLWEYPAFSGVVNVGPVPSGVPFELRYLVEAQVTGNSPVSGAAAAINDPFGARQLPLVTIDQAGSVPGPGPRGVPEPGTAVLVLIALGLASVAGRRRAAED